MKRLWGLFLFIKKTVGKVFWKHTSSRFADSNKFRKWIHSLPPGCEPSQIYLFVCLFVYHHTTLISSSRGRCGDHLWALHCLRKSEWRVTVHQSIVGREAELSAADGSLLDSAGTFDDRVAFVKRRGRRPLLGEANVGGLWRRVTPARHIAAPLRTESRSRDVGSCVDGQRRFYFPRETSKLCIPSNPAVNGWEAGGISQPSGSFFPNKRRFCFLLFLLWIAEDAVKDVDQQPRSGEEIAGEHADGLALPLHGVQEEISPCQRG